jgi:hypothetical protein
MRQRVLETSGSRVVFHSALPGSWNWRRRPRARHGRGHLHAWIGDPDVAPLASAAWEMPGDVAAAYR